MAVTPEPDVQFTRLLERAVRGEDEAAAAVLPRVYHELQKIAVASLRPERDDHTLQPTALIHECWLKLFGEHSTSYACRAEFFQAAVEAMRRVLVDHARRRLSRKRGGDRERVPLTAVEPSIDANPERFLALDEAIEQLRSTDPRAAEVVRLRFFAGLSIEETSTALKTSQRTVYREWCYARAMLLRSLAGGEEIAGS